MTIPMAWALQQETLSRRKLLGRTMQRNQFNGTPTEYVGILRQAKGDGFSQHRCKEENLSPDTILHTNQVID
jgi:hypothetical protein